jgi:hypothetical protein
MPKSKSSVAQTVPPPSRQLPRLPQLPASKYQNFQVRRIHRRELKDAPYNPRRIDSYAREKLQKNLRTVGLLEPPIWNQRTGHIVGGHQRIAALDALEGGDDYYLDVAVTNLDEKTEREQNVALNNSAIQGQWDIPLLAELMKGDGFDISKAGFDAMDLQVMFDDKQLAGLFAKDLGGTLADLSLLGALGGEASTPGTPGTPKEPDADADEEDLDDGDDGDGEDEDDEEGDTEPSPAPPPLPKDALASPESVLARIKATRVARDEAESTETYAVVVFGTPQERAHFMTVMGLPPVDRYVDGNRLWHKLGPEVRPHG